ncbi:MAG: hypothetical protein ACR2LN_01380 [Candidatus Levyibacteriota bacterium]
MTADTFYSELNNLLSRYPKVPPDISESENSEYGEHLAYCKNMYIAFDCANSSDCMYLYDSYIAKNCIDCDYVVESELCYESVDPFKCFNSDYLEYCISLRDASFSTNCINCHDIFGCVNLQNKSFCIFNRQLTEEEYKRKVAEYKKWPPEKILAVVDELKNRYPLTQTHEAHNENSAYGNYSHYNKNCYMCFDSAHNEASGYLYDSHHTTSCYDSSSSYHNELSYQAVDAIKLFNCNFSVLSGNAHDSSYIFNCRNVKDCIGCVSLNNKQYCILNRQLSKEDYERISKHILEELKSKNLGWNELHF